jgi:hypothetical protein
MFAICKQTVLTDHGANTDFLLSSYNPDSKFQRKHTGETTVNSGATTIRIELLLISLFYFPFRLWDSINQMKEPNVCYICLTQVTTQAASFHVGAWLWPKIYLKWML